MLMMTPAMANNRLMPERIMPVSHCALAFLSFMLTMPMMMPMIAQITPTPCMGNARKPQQQTLAANELPNAGNSMTIATIPKTIDVTAWPFPLDLRGVLPSS